VIAQAVVAILRAETASLADGFARSGGVVNVACAGQTSWQGFASAIVAGLRSRGVKLAVESVAPIKTSDYPTKAKRPGNSRLDLSRLEDVFGVVTPSWNEALAVELDELTRELR
jgi:dTDP-4-dehydrorhamnose reductase